MIEAMIFDAGGVLLRENTSVTDDLRQELGLSHEQLNYLWSSDIPMLGAGKISEEEFWQHVSDHFGVRKVLPEENLLGRAFAANLVKNEEVYDLISDLGEMGITLAVLSNTIEAHDKVMENAGLLKPFKHRLMSYEMSLRKPDPAIYESALKELGLRPEKVGFTDDAPINVETAQALGINSVLFKDAAQLRQQIEKWA